MKNPPSTLLLVSLFGVAVLQIATAQNSSFLYQGRLADNAVPAEGFYDIHFSVYDLPMEGALVAPALTQEAVKVRGGLFTSTLDFGPSVFNGDPRWLELAVRTNQGEMFVPLEPRQRIAPTPYAIRSETAGTLDGLLPESALLGNYGNAVMLSHPDNDMRGSFAGNGEGLINVHALTLGGYHANDFWQRGGNAGTITGADFLGTTDPQPLEFKVNGERVLRLEPGGDSGDGGSLPDGAPNVLGGSPANLILEGAVGATIAGGGATNYAGVAHPNEVWSDYAFIGGGLANQVGIVSLGSAIGGGSSNQIKGYSPMSVISGGFAGGVGPNASYSAIGGGYFNQVGQWSDHATIAGGYMNRVDAESDFGVIGGGTENRVSHSSLATIAGGSRNEISTNSTAGAIGGGSVNKILGNAQGSTVSGGVINTIGGNATNSTIGGGSFNSIYDRESIIAGGVANFISSRRSFIGGGRANAIESAAGDAVISGGHSNRVMSAGYGGFIGGGLSNIVRGEFGAVPGGNRNQAAGKTSLAAGYRAQANHDGSFVWADASNTDFSSTASNQFLIRANGGVGINKSNPGSTLDVNGAVAARDLVVTPGNVGLGTATPESRLDVRGTVLVQYSAAGNHDNVAMKKTGDVSPSNARFVLSHRSNGTQLWCYGYDGSTYLNLQGWDYASNAVRFPANGNTLYVAEKTDRVGVKTDAPAFDLHVNGTAGKPGGGAWSVASDERLKKNIHPLGGALDRLLQLRGVCFEYKDPEAVHELPGERMGMIAQEVESVFPDWVETDDEGIKRLTVRGFEALAVEAMRQLREEKDAEIDALRREMEDLKQLVHSFAQSQEETTE